MADQNLPLLESLLDEEMLFIQEKTLETKGMESPELVVK